MIIIISEVSRKHRPILSINGISENQTLNIIDKGSETITPTTAAVEDVLFQNKPRIKIASIPGLINPVNSCINWNA
jgi:hypothetical protein